LKKGDVFEIRRFGEVKNQIEGSKPALIFLLQLISTALIIKAIYKTFLL
jgi:hypothetical protein